MEEFIGQYRELTAPRPGRTVGEITWRLRSYHGPCIIGASSWNG